MVHYIDVNLKFFFILIMNMLNKHEIKKVLTILLNTMAHLFKLIYDSSTLRLSPRFLCRPTAFTST
jgi:hypothetical protein